MLSISTIDRALEQRDYDRLLRDLGRNGLVMPLPLRVQLAESAVGACGLGLRRLIELTYGPTALTRQLIDKLIRAQASSGIKTGAIPDAAGRPSCLLTACFAAGLGRVLRDHADRLGDQRVEIESAYGRAVAALSTMQGPDGLFTGPQDRHDRDRLLTSAFIAYLLIDAPAFAERCRGHALLSALEDRHGECGPATAELIDMARLTRLLPAGATSPTDKQANPAEPIHTQPNLLTAA